jgi:hypothetical protein
MMWFGAAHGAPYEHDSRHATTPIGEACAWCGEKIVADDTGILMPMLGLGVTSMRPYHYACHVRGIIGGLNHLRGRCTCCGGPDPPDPPGMSRRESARLAVEHWLSAR